VTEPRYSGRVPRVSILIPTYEPQAAHLRAALDCVLAQTHEDWTVLIHDDFSRTDMRSILEPYLTDPRIRYARSGRRLGIGGNWNACLATATGDYVQFLFQDDTWKPAYLESCVRILEKEKGIGFTAAAHAYACEAGTPESRASAYADLAAFRARTLQPGLQKSDAFLRWWTGNGLRPNVIGEPSFVMLRRTLVREVGPFLEDMPQNLDVEYWLRCMLRADWWNLAENLGSFRVHAAGASARNDAAGLGLFDRLRLYEYLLGHAPSPELRGLARRSLTEQFGLMARKFFRRTRGGGGVSADGSGALLRLCLRHPVLVAGGLLRAMGGRSA
jgi:glycosyltransferase involved in cell wall biosynthesis